MNYTYLLAAGLLLGSVAAGRAQAPAYDTTPIVETFEDNRFNWSLAPNPHVELRLEPGQGLHLRSLAVGDNSSSATNQFAVDGRGDYSIELQARVQGAGGLRVGPETDYLLLQVLTAASLARVQVFRNQGGQWSKLADVDWPAGAAPPAADHALRVGRRANRLRCELDGQLVYEAAAGWLDPTLKIGMHLDDSNTHFWARRLTLSPRRPIRLAPGVPADLRRQQLPGSINSASIERRPVVSADGRWLYFSRVMNPAAKEVNDENSDVYVAERRGAGEWGAAYAPGRPLNNASNNTVETLTPDGQNVLIRGIYSAAGEFEQRGLSLSRHLPDGSWTQPTAFFRGDFLPEGGDRNDAALDASGRFLVIGSSLRGQPDNSDLFVLERYADGTWSKARSLGPTLNTPGEEQAPFLAADGKTLYFSSNQHGGYGDHDIFMTRRLDDSWKRWSEPLNLGPGINSPGYDSHFSVPASGAYGYLSSVAATALDSRTDVFQVQLPPSLRPQATLLVRGQVLDARTRQPVPGATISYEQLPQGEAAGQLPPAGNGSYQLVLPAGQEYGFRASAPGYVSVNENVDLRDANAYGEQTVNLYLLPLAAPTATELRALRETAPTSTSIYDALTLPTAATPPAPRPAVRLADLALDPVAAPARPAPARTTPEPAPTPPPTPTPVAQPAPAPAPPSAAPAAPVVVEEKIVLHNVFFKKGEPVLLPGSYPELQRLSRTLQENPGLQIRLDGHTDNTGDDRNPQPNQTLSEQRVAAVKTYLVAQGVAAGRLSTRGYGGSRPVAPNTTEANKAQNRRVEFVILRR